MLPFLGVAQLAGAGGLLIGVWWGPLGVAAAICLTLYFIGAVATHVRVGDIKAPRSPCDRGRCSHRLARRRSLTIRPL
ncbi:DoxX family protein [Nocardia asteroides]|nr:DoxX family protein [Nocardia asteroides]